MLFYLMKPRVERFLLVGIGLAILSLVAYSVTDARIRDVGDCISESLSSETEADDCDDIVLATQIRLVSLIGVLLGATVAALAWPLNASESTSAPTTFSTGHAEAEELWRRGALTQEEYEVVLRRL